MVLTGVATATLSFAGAAAAAAKKTKSPNILKTYTGTQSERESILSIKK